MTIKELETFFETTEIPQTVMLNSAVKINDTSIFLSTNIPRVKAWGGDLNKCPSYWHLMNLVEVLSE